MGLGGMHGRLLNLLQSTLLIELSGMMLTPIDIAPIMRDFASGRRHVWMTFQLKFSFWLQLPWLGFILWKVKLVNVRCDDQCDLPFSKFFLQVGLLRLCFSRRSSFLSSLSTGLIGSAFLGVVGLCMIVPSWVVF